MRIWVIKSPSKFLFSYITAVRLLEFFILLLCFVVFFRDGMVTIFLLHRNLTKPQMCQCSAFDLSVIAAHMLAVGPMLHIPGCREVLSYWLRGERFGPERKRNFLFTSCFCHGWTSFCISFPQSLNPRQLLAFCCQILIPIFLEHTWVNSWPQRNYLWFSFHGEMFPDPVSPNVT